MNEYTTTIEINAPAQMIWGALTNKDLLCKWMLDTEIEVNSTWQVGSEVTIQAKINGLYTSKGKVIVANPPNTLAYTSWTKISKLIDEPENYALVKFTLLEKPHGTLVTLTNSNLIAAAAFEHARFYWMVALNKLKLLVEKNKL